MEEYIKDRVNLLLSLFDEQIIILSLYQYVDTDLIERTWDNQLKQISRYMGVTEDSYELIWGYFLDGYVVVGNRKIKDQDELIDYLVEQALEKAEKAE